MLDRFNDVVNDVLHFMTNKLLLLLLLPPIRAFSAKRLRLSFSLVLDTFCVCPEFTVHSPVNF
jgi:hypothetical protein